MCGHGAPLAERHTDGVRLVVWARGFARGDGVQLHADATTTWGEVKARALRGLAQLHPGLAPAAAWEVVARNGRALEEGSTLQGWPHGAEVYLQPRKA